MPKVNGKTIFFRQGVKIVLKIYTFSLCALIRVRVVSKMLAFISRTTYNNICFLKHCART